jgi:sulfite exporter TauE/SafE
VDAIRPYVLVAAGVFMVVVGLGMTGRVPWAARLSPRPPRILVQALRRVQRKARNDSAAQHRSLLTPIAFGLLTGLFPCAPLIAAELTAVSSGSVLSGGVAMFAFGLGTAPLLFAFGVASTLLPRQMRQRMVAVLAVLVVAFGVVYVSRGLTRLGLPVTPTTARQALFGESGARTAPALSYDAAADGVKEVHLTIADVQFAPSTLSVPVDEPFRLIIDRREANACSDQLAVPELGLLADLAPNTRTTIDVPAASAGAYTLTCGMGMMSGQIVAGAAPAKEPSPLAWAGLGLTGVAAWYAVARPHAGSPGPRRTLWGLRRSTALFFLGALAFALLAGLSLGGAFSA